MNYSIIKNDTLAHSGKKGMKWGYNDGSRNGRRTAAEISAVKKQMEEMAKTDSSIKVGDDIQGDYDEANNMLKYLGITLDMQSDNEAVVRTMQVYKEMANNKDKYENQYEWLKDFTNKLSGIGYDMSAAEKFLDEKKADINKIETGSGTGDRSKSNADWKENDAKKSSKKSSSSSEKKSSSKSSNTKKKASTKTKNTKPVSYSVKKKVSESKNIRDKTTINHSIVLEGDELYHHGILGQKWGVRRYQNSDGSLTSEGRKRYGKSGSSDYGVAKGRNNSAKKYSKKRASKMSNAELEAAANRLNKEANYKNASDRLKNKTDSGKAAVDKIQNLALATGAIVTIAANSDKIIKIGKVAAEKVLSKL